MLKQNDSFFLRFRTVSTSLNNLAAATVTLKASESFGRRPAALIAPVPVPWFLLPFAFCSFVCLGFSRGFYSLWVWFSARAWFGDGKDFISVWVSSVDPGCGRFRSKSEWFLSPCRCIRLSSRSDLFAYLSSGRGSFWL